MPEGGKARKPLISDMPGGSVDPPAGDEGLIPYPGGAEGVGARVVAGGVSGLLALGDATAGSADGPGAIGGSYGLAVG